MSTLEKMTQNLDPDKPTFPISVIAEMLMVHQRTLRIYDDEKILTPGRSPKNRRLYSINDIERGKFVQYMTRELGINLAGIKIIFGLLGKNYFHADWLTTINKIVTELGITEEAQKFNREKLSKRGRKKNKQKEGKE